MPGFGRRILKTPGKEQDKTFAYIGGGFLLWLLLFNIVVKIYNIFDPTLTTNKALKDLIPLSFTKPSTYLALSAFLLGGLFWFGFLKAKESLFPDKKNDLGSAKFEKPQKALKGLLYEKTKNEPGLWLAEGIQLNAKTCDEHGVVFGPTGSGKTTSFFIPNLLMLPPDTSGVVTDPKLELFELTSQEQQRKGRNTLIFAPLRPECTLGYNPLAWVNNVTEIKEIAQTLLVNGAAAIEQMTGQKSGGAEWLNMSAPLWTAAMIHVKYKGKYGTIAEALDLVTNNEARDLDRIFATSTPEALREYNIFKQAAGSDKTASSIKVVLASNLQLFTDPIIRAITSVNEIDPKELRDKPTILYVSVPEHKSAFVAPLMSVFFTQLLNFLTEYNKGNRVFFLLDEFANIGNIPMFAQRSATVRSRRMPLWICIQSLSQLARNYGKENALDIVNNLKTKVILPGLNDEESTKFVSSLCGYTTVNTNSKSYEKLYEGPKSFSTSAQGRELLKQDEVRRLQEHEVLIVAHNRNPVKAKKWVYYKDKTLSKKVTPQAPPLREKPLEAVYDDPIQEDLDDFPWDKNPWQNQKSFPCNIDLDDLIEEDDEEDPNNPQKPPPLV